MTTVILNIIAIISLLTQALHSSNNFNFPDWFGFFGFMFYPIVILLFVERYNSCSLEYKPVFIKRSIFYSLSLLLLNTGLLFLEKEASSINLVHNNIFLSFLVFIYAKKLFRSINSKRLSKKCNSLFLILLIISVYLPLDNNFLCLCLFFIFDKINNSKLFKNISIILLSIFNPILKSNFYSMGIFLSLIFINEYKPCQTKNRLDSNTYVLFVFIFIAISNISKILL